VEGAKRKRSRGVRAVCAVKAGGSSMRATVGGGQRSVWHPLDLEIGEGDGALTCGPRGTVTGGGEFDSNSNFKRIRIIFKFFQILTAPKGPSRALKILNKIWL
jgi:hypothetical protein